MGQVRSVTYSFEMNVPAADVETKYINKLLRDILPDQAFEVLWVVGNFVSSCGPEDGVLMELSKNITPAVERTMDVFSTFHGDLLFWNHGKELAENVAEVWSDQIVFTPPLDFDANDELNMRLYATNNGTSSYAVGFFVTLGYRAR